MARHSGALVIRDMPSLPIPLLQRVLKATLPTVERKRLLAIVERLQIKSLRAAIREQGLWELQERLSEIVPDVRHQYTAHELDSDYLILKVRGQHAFQASLANEAIRGLRNVNGSLTLIDVGDSAGTHIQYLRALNKDRNLRCISMNLDEEAVQKIRKKGLEAVCARAEDIAARSLDADLFVSFEMLEHLPNPSHFLRTLSYKTTCRALVFTVPYVAQSRVGFHHIRHGLQQVNTPEMTHIFELSPADWRLLFMHAGWSVQQERLYLQYPRYGLWRVMKPVWRTLDFEGFWGGVLQREHSWSDLYVGGA